MLLVSGTAGTITEFQIGEIHVRAAADLAFVTVSALGFPLLLLAHSGLELNGLMRMLMADFLPLETECTGHIIPEEYQEVGKGDNGQQGTDKVQSQQCAQHIHRKQCHVDQSQPLHLKGDDEEQQHLCVRIQCRKG